MAPRTPSRGPRRFARALLAGTPVEIGRAPAAPLGEAAGQRGASARLPDAVVDHGTNRRTHPEGIRSALPSRSCRSADAYAELEPSETGNSRHRARRRSHRALEAEG